MVMALPIFYNSFVKHTEAQLFWEGRVFTQKSNMISFSFFKYTAAAWKIEGRGTKV